MHAFDDVPVGTWLALGGVVLAVLGYITGDLSYQEALLGAGAATGGAGAIGLARAQSGKGGRR